MNLNDILDAGDRDRQANQNTLADRSRAAEHRLNGLLEEAIKSLTEALTDTPGLGEVVVRGGNRVERRPERVSRNIVAQSAGERLAVLVEGKIAWLPGNGLGEIGRGEATSLSVTVQRTDRSMMTDEKFTFPIAFAGPMQGRYPVQREAFQMRLAEAVKKLAQR
jgi:hypothetical protein